MSGFIGRVPLRNIWLLILYAYEMARFIGQYDADVERARDLDELIAFLLAEAVERRLRRNLSRGYVERRDVLTRVRGRIDILRTYANALPERGEVACRFDEHTNDVPRNRLVRRALEDIAARIGDRALARRCRDISRRLEAMGVAASRGRHRLSTWPRVQRHEHEDELMVTAARWVYELALPTEEQASNRTFAPDRDEGLVRRLFERAVANFCRREFRSNEGWSVSRQKHLSWQARETSVALDEYLPRMEADVVIDHHALKRRLVIETKFTGILSRNKFEGDRFRSQHLYQVYSYLRTQETEDGKDSVNAASALVLYPSIGKTVDESALFHGHRIHFATIDLCETPESIRSRLKWVVERTFR